MNNLENQVVIVTGGAAGIGGALTSILCDDSQYMTGQTLMADGGDIKLR